MKSVFTLALTALIASNAFAAQHVSGEKAQHLFSSLKNIGVTSRQFTEAASISVSDVRAGTTFARGRIGHVELTDNNTGKVVRASDPAPNDTTPVAGLIDAMKDVGVKETVRMGGSSLEDVRSIQCEVAHMGARGFYDCTIEK